MSIEERLDALEAQVRELTRHPVRDEVKSMRDVHGARLAAIDARLTAIEHDTGETGWIEARFTNIDASLGEAIALLREMQG